MQRIHRTKWAELLALLAVLLGIFVRFQPTLLTNFPVTDGGMFAVMVNDLQANGYRLPAFTSYNQARIPFAYPPLGFYAGGLAADLFGWGTLASLRWVPALFASLSLAAFYLLSRLLFKDRVLAAFATLIFALMPRALSWYVMGGGLTRSPGLFFMLLTLAAGVSLFGKCRWRDLFLTGFFAGLTMMSHPEAAVHMAASLLLLWIMLERSRFGFFKLAAAGAIAVLVSAPWWGTVLHFHGPGPLLSALQTGQKSSAIFSLVFFDFADEPYATLIMVLALIGIAQRLLHRDFLLPLWLALPFLVEGRSAILPASIPLAMLAAIGLVQVVLRGLVPGTGQAGVEADKVSYAEMGITAYVLFYLLFSTSQYGWQLAGTSLSVPDRTAMEWVRGNTERDARFVVLTGTNSISCDMTLEWFPALTDRPSPLTVQGSEWTEGSHFTEFVHLKAAVQRCVVDGSLSCLDQKIDRQAYDYIYLSKIPRLNCSPVDIPVAFASFIRSLEAEGFETVYETEEIVIFKK